MMPPVIQYCPDEGIDAAGDREIRDLLSTCFLKPQDFVFKTQRYFCEPYAHRWIIRDEQGMLVAHVGLHEKTVQADGTAFPIGGVCEVCVHPNCRGRGYVRAMLRRVHAWLREHDFPFALLFGNPRVYGSSGYVELSNLYLNDDDKGWTPVRAMAKILQDTRWPEGEVHLVGPKF